MEKDKIDMFLLTNSKYFEANKLAIITKRLESCDDSDLLKIQSCDFKDPTTLLLVSIFLGCLGIDRFMLGQTGMGILKLFTGGLCGILTIIDWFTIMKKTKEKNFNTLVSII